MAKFIYVKDPFKTKHQLLINGTEKVGTKNLEIPKAFIDYSQRTDDVYENLKGYNPTKERNMLIVFDDMIADIESNTNLSPIGTELFLRGRNPNISIVFTSQSCFKVSKTINLTARHYFNRKIPIKTELQQIASNHSSEIDCKDFIKIYKDYTKEPYLFQWTIQLCHQIIHYVLGRSSYKNDY